MRTLRDLMWLCVVKAMGNLDIASEPSGSRRTLAGGFKFHATHLPNM